MHFLAFLVTAVVGAAFVLFSPIFRISHVEVYGTLFLDRSAVVGAVDLIGKNPFTVDTHAEEQRVLALGVPERVSVAFRLPDTAIVDVVERQPVYIWKVDPALYLVADDGTILGPTFGEHGRVVVVDLDHRPVRVGQIVDARFLREAAYLRGVLPRVTNLSPAYFYYSRAFGLMVRTIDGIQVAFGDDQDLDAKLRALGPVLQAARSQNPRPNLVDLQYAGHPFLR